MSGLIEVPGDWNGFEVSGKKIYGDGYATYRLRILLGETRERMAFKFLDMAVAFSVYVNGKRLTSAGMPGKTSDTTVAQFHPHVVDFNPDLAWLDVIIQVSNFHHRRGGAWEPIHIGLADDIRAIRQHPDDGNLPHWSFCSQKEREMRSFFRILLFSDCSKKSCDRGKIYHSSFSNF